MEELEFILNNLEQLEKGSLCIAIIPMRCALYDSGEGVELKEKLLNNHTLEAVLSMPDELFYNSNVGTNTCIMVTKAKEKHPKNYKTYFGYWKDDGFYKKRTSGRADYDHTWNQIKNYWLENYRNRDEVVEHSVKKSIKPTDEWCVEQYMTTDYKELNEELMRTLVLNYLSFCVSRGKFIAIKDFINENKKLKLDTETWKDFEVGKLFDVTLGKAIHKNTIKDFSKTNKKEFIPYVTRTTKNNGVELYVHNSKIDTDKYMKGNAITIGAEGFKAFYQEETFITGNKVNILRNDKLNLKIALFLNSVLNLEIEKKFGYGRGLVQKRIEKLSIKLPVDSDGKPDWKFMEDFILSLDYE
ncbi:MAG: restriction endonuclease subunit S [Sulfurimonas sp.]|nr:restriction endonuclease subunit S [Sulfurimonas sp.]